LEFRCSDIFEKPSRKGRGKDFEVLAQRQSEGAQGAVFAGGEVDGFFVGAREKARFGAWRSLGRLRFGDGGGWCFLDDRVANGWGGFGGTIDFDEVLLEPKVDFFKTTLGFVRHLEKINLGLVVMVEVVSDDMLELGIGASTDVAGNIMTVFIHNEEDVGAVKVLPEALVGAKETFSVSAVIRSEWLARIKARDWTILGGVFVGVGIILKNWGRPVDDLVATTFKITSPVDGTFVKFGATANNEFFHDCK